MSHREFAETVRTLIGFSPVRELFIFHVERWRRKRKIIAEHIRQLDELFGPLTQMAVPFSFSDWALHGAGDGQRCKVPPEFEARYQRLQNRPLPFPRDEETRIRDRTPSENFIVLAAVHDSLSGRADFRLGPSELGESPRGEQDYCFEVWRLRGIGDQTALLRNALIFVLAQLENRIAPTITNRDGELLADIIVRIRKQWGIDSAKSLAIQAKVSAEIYPATVQQVQGLPAQEVVKVYLQGWGEILNLLTLDNNSTNQRRIRELNARFQGPIILPGQGGQPKVVKDDLIVWHNGLEERFRNESAQRDDAFAQAEADQAATVAGQYQHGKGGPDGQGTTVVPELGGHVRDRRATS